MSEENLLNKIFNQPLWKNYPLMWCDLCDTAIISCPKCNNGSCSGGGCVECHNDFVEFSNYCTHIENYLTDEENKVYQKSLRLRRLILKSLAAGEKRIDFKKCQEKGWLSENEEKMFEKELISPRTLKMLDKSVKNLKKRKISKQIKYN